MKYPSPSDSLTPAQARALRLKTGLSPQEWAAVLHVPTQTVRSAECKKAPVRQFALLMRVLSNDAIRMLLPAALDEAEKFLQENIE